MPRIFLVLIEIIQNCYEAIFHPSTSPSTSKQTQNLATFKLKVFRAASSGACPASAIQR